ncbi:Torsin-1B, partial [Stegodyphus mimosarum]
MYTTCIRISIFYIIIIFPVISCFGTVMTALNLIGGPGALMSVICAKWPYICFMSERCDDYWVHFNSAELGNRLKKHLYGQHLVAQIVPQSLKAHVAKAKPNKALVMSFHGWTGSGKNHVSKMIIESLYLKGFKSNFVHWYIASYDFPHATEIKAYCERLQMEIIKFTKECGQSLFIFDEMDKMVPGVIDVLKPFINFYEDVGGIDFRKNIFIFLSNAGGSEITRIAFNFWLDGKDREDITLRDIEPLINKGAFNENGGLQHSEIVEKNLIDVYVPFLPLEKKHVKQCIIDELKMRQLTVNESIVNQIADQIIYQPQDFELFSTSG